MGEPAWATPDSSLDEALLRTGSAREESSSPPSTLSETPSGTGRPAGQKANWTILAFVALIVSGYAFYFATRPDGRIPVRLTGFQDLQPNLTQGEYSAELLETMLGVMENSEVVRPANNDSEFRFLQSGFLALDSVRLILHNLDPGTEPILVRSHPLRAPVSAGDLEALAARLAQDIESAVSDRSEPPLPMRGTSNLAASQAYLEGRALWALRDPEEFQGARRAFEEAVRADSTYALAYAALADVFNLLGAYDYGILHPDSAYRLAKSAAERAYSLDPELAETHAALATTQFFYEWNLAGAEALYRSGLRLDPTYEPGHQWLSLLLAVQKRFDPALAEVREATGDDPSEVVLAAQARIHYFARDFRQALFWYERALEVEDHFIPAHLGRGLTAVMAGEVETALEAYGQAERYLGGPVPVTLAVRGHLLGRIGDSIGARQVLGYLEQARAQYQFVPPEYLAMVHLGLGELEKAMDYLEEAHENGSNVMTILEVDPLLDPLETNERFLRLKSRVREGRIR